MRYVVLALLLVLCRVEVSLAQAPSAQAPAKGWCPGSSQYAVGHWLRAPQHQRQAVDR